MSLDLGTPKVLELVLKLKQYPILSQKIRERMRQEIFGRGIITPQDFEKELRNKARESQIREGLRDPLVDEDSHTWTQRLTTIRDDLSDFYFAHNCPPTLLDHIVQEVVNPQMQDEDFVLSFNPELAPWAMLFARGEEYESYEPERKAKVQHHLQEMVVVLTKGMLSDQLDFVGLAREFLTIDDLKEIRHRRIGRGKIGGKAAGMMLAWKIVQRLGAESDPALSECISIPDSYFIGADVFYDFQALNNLVPFMNQKYKSLDEIRADYPKLRQAYIGGDFPEDVKDRLRSLLDEVGNAPIVVRSSSLLEDNFGFSFAGKYDSYFLPSQGTPDGNLTELMHAISAVYASVISPDALAYRRRMGLLDYDERMAVLIQKVVGTRHRGYFLPALAGVAFSRNPFRWNPRIRREDGLVRLVWGLGTRAVERVSNDYPRMIALSHPSLRPEMDARAVSKYSQRFVDVLNLQANTIETLPVSEILSSRYPGAQLLASVNKGDYVQPMLSLLENPDPQSLILTFDNLIARTNFVPLIKFLLKTVERHYQRPVDVEFAVQELSDRSGSRVEISLLQCRPLSFRQEGKPVRIPHNVPEEDRLFSANRLAPQGVVSDVRYIVWVDPAVYDQIQDPAAKMQVARVVGRLNQALQGESFILMGPGRWGSSNLNLGVKVSYADLDHARVLIEVALAHGSHAPEASHGTHFYQDLVEAQIYPLPLYPDDPDTIFNWQFFDTAPNVLGRLVPDCAHYEDYVKVIDVPEATGGRLLEIVMDGDNDEALGYLK
ncbi:MAG: PEP/pyruvate-binding domain-containing protein [Anaerolineae bacterium]|nr:PEP/pyruvate-binding domain-containing protein [Anaerolineae bacterium]